MKDQLKNTTVEKIMNKHVATVGIDDEVSDVHSKFMNDRVHHVVVVDAQKHVVGLISQKYLYKTQSPRKVMNEEMQFRPDLLRDGDAFYNKETLDGYILSRIMRKDPFTLTLNQTVEEAILHMANKKISCIPVVDEDKKIKGLITEFDVIGFIGKLIS